MTGNMLELKDYDIEVAGIMLRMLTECLAEEGHKISGGLLGGDFGYGASYDDEIMMMHPYCWCDKEECPWCAFCICEEVYLINGIKSSFDEWLSADYSAKSLGKVLNNACLLCSGKFEKEGSIKLRKKYGESREESLWTHAPNFWHKPSGLRIWWYKYIGRGMEFFGPEDVNIYKILSECIVGKGFYALFSFLKR